MKHGLWLSLVTVLFWAFYDVVVRFLGTEWHVQPLVFTALVNLVAALGLLTVAGRGALGVHTIKQSHTWIYSFTMILMDVVFIFAVLYASATEVNFLNRTTIVASAFLCWFALGRKVTLWQAPGLLLVLLGVGVIASTLPDETRPISLFFVGVMVVCHTVRTFVTETHPSVDEAEVWADRARVTGYVLLITSLGFLLVALGFAAAFDGVGGGMFPQMSDFTDPHSLLAAIVLGVLIISPSNYIYFQAAKKAGADGFLMVAAFLPVFCFGFEYVAAQYGWLDIKTISGLDLVGGAFITGGALWGVIAKVSGADYSPTPREKSFMAQAQGCAHAALVHFDNDKKRAAAGLGVSASVFDGMMKSSRLFGVNTYKKAKKNFDAHVISRDPLTGLQNRLTFLTRLNKHLAKVGDATLFMVDLNKFKPVNDTYGHAAGDAVLREVAHRLYDSYGHRAEITRLGGDEYCLLFYKLEPKAEVIATRIQEIIAAPIAVMGIDEDICVTASVGFSRFPEAGPTAEDLLRAADKAMYQDKADR